MNTLILLLLSWYVLPGAFAFRRTWSRRFLLCGGQGLGWILNPGGGSTNPGVPGAANVSTDYLNLIGGYAAGVPTLLGAQQQFQPGFINSALAGTQQSLYGGQGQQGLLADLLGSTGQLTQLNTGANTATRAAQVGDVGALGPAAAAAVGAINPGQTQLIGQLTGTAATGLAAGSELDPQTLRQITQGVRSDWASRGLGSSQPAQLDEAVQEAVGGQGLLQAREAAAGGAIQAGNIISQPAFSLLGGQSQVPQQAFSLLGGGTQFQGSAGSTVINPNAAYDTFNTAYNARAASQIAAAQNQAALDAY